MRWGALVYVVTLSVATVAAVLEMPPRSAAVETACAQIDTAWWAGDEGAVREAVRRLLEVPEVDEETRRAARGYLSTPPKAAGSGRLLDELRETC